MSHSIRIATSKVYPKIMKIWESAVKVPMIFYLKPILSILKKVIPIDYLPNLEVYLISENNDIKGFGSASDDMLEMLFIHNDFHGKGLGKISCLFLKEKTDFSKS